MKKSSISSLQRASCFSLSSLTFSVILQKPYDSLCLDVSIEVFVVFFFLKESPRKFEREKKHRLRITKTKKVRFCMKGKKFYMTILFNNRSVVSFLSHFCSFLRFEKHFRTFFSGVTVFLSSWQSFCLSANSINELL